MADDRPVPDEFKGVSPADKGVLVWRINKFTPEKVPPKQHGQFFQGDSYLVLNRFKD